jgi:putative tricarboxylic transport membrane protein
MLSALLCAILTFPMGMAFNKFAVKILSVNKAYLIPAVFILCMAGSYADRKFVFDNYLCFVAGITGIIMAKGHYPAAPFILAFILEPILEQNFIRATLISRGSLKIFIQSPICIVMWIIIAITLLLPLSIKLYKKISNSSSVDN